MSEKRKRKVVGASTNIFNKDERTVHYMNSINTLEDGDSSDPDNSDVEEDACENKQNEEGDGGEADSLDEDDIEDASGEEEEEGESTESEEDSGDDEAQDNKEGKVEGDSGIDDTSEKASKGAKQTKVKKKFESKKVAVISRDSSSKQEPQTFNEYNEDSSDEEDLRNTIGNVPLKWYDDYPHLGYNLDGKEITKPVRGDTLDEFLNRMENPDYNRTVFDKQTGQDVRLSDKDLDAVKRVMKYRVPDAEYDMYAPWIDHFTYEVMEMPLSGRPEHKASFIPSKSEAAYVAKRAEQIRRGLIKFSRRKGGVSGGPRYYDLWTDDQKLRGIHDHLPAPRSKLPGHGESYNPPVEYIRKANKRFKSVREIPGFKFAITERYERCLDLYIAPRKKVMRVTLKAKELLPVLPKPADLLPFPRWEGLIFKGHRSIIRTISIHPLGRYLASGSDDHTVKIWEVSTGRCLRSFDVEAAVKCVAWNPSSKLFLLAVVIENKVIFMNPETYLTDKLVVQQTNSVFRDEPDQGDYIQPERVKTASTWRKPTADEWAKGYRIIIEFFRTVKQIVWHKQGDYFATLIPEGDHRSVMMHQLSRWRSQVPFNKLKGRVQCLQFHPKMPFLYVATQGHVRVYNLQKQRMLKKVKANSRWISSIAIHPGGEHFLIGGYDRKVNWFEMEYTKRPLVLRYHKEAVRSVAYHRKYPLFASASDEGRVIVSHGMVYNDWLKDPFLVPVKELRGHSKFQDLCVLDLTWHPYEPYLFTSGADSTIRLWH